MERRKQITYILDSSTENLCNNLQLQNILQRLKTRQVLSGDDIREITSSPRMDDQVDRLLEMLKRRPSTAYDEFMSPLLEFRPDLFHEVQAIEVSYVPSSFRNQYCPPPPAPAAQYQPRPPAGGSHIPSTCRPSQPSQPAQPSHQATAAAANLGATSYSIPTQPVPNTFPADLSKRINRLCIITCNFGIQQGDTSTQEDLDLSDNPLNMDGPHGMPSFENISPLDMNMAVPGSVPCYPMTHKRNGLAIIFNNDKFEKKHPYYFEERRDSGEDACKLVKLFQLSLKFEVQYLTNLTAQQMHDVLDETRRYNHHYYNCFVCCIMSHGKRDTVFEFDSMPIHIHELTGLFNGIKCNSLLEKPKMFFIQACQGDFFQPGASLQSDNPQSGTSDILSTIPIENDFLVGYSTVPGYVSFRHPKQGSWYITALTRFIHELHGRVDMANIPAMVNGHISKDSDKAGNKQSCSYRSTLTKALYL